MPDYYETIYNAMQKRVEGNHSSFVSVPLKYLVDIPEVKALDEGDGLVSIYYKSYLAASHVKSTVKLKSLTRRLLQNSKLSYVVMEFLSELYDVYPAQEVMGYRILIQEMVNLKDELDTPESAANKHHELVFELHILRNRIADLERGGEVGG